MGLAAAGVCFGASGSGTSGEAAAAAAHLCGTLYPTQGGIYLVSCTAHSGACGVGGCTASLTLSAVPVTGGATVNGVRVASLTQCDPLTWTSGPGPWEMSVEDAGLVAAAVASVWLLAAAWRYIRAALGDHNRDE